MTLLLVSGKAGSGKTTLSHYLTQTHPQHELFVEFALADKLKQLTFKLLKLFDVPINSVADLDNRATKEKYRKYLQQIATECVRSTFGEDFWCQQILSDVMSNLEQNKNVIISDIRFPNEQQFFETNCNHPVHKIMIERNGISSVTQHSSENTSSLSVDTVITNNASFEAFYSSIDNLVSNIIDPIDDLVELPEPDAPIIERSPIAPLQNDQVYVQLYNEKNTANSSQRLGVIGEETVCNMIQQIRPKIDTHITAHTAHVADLHSRDYERNILWVIEVKHKGQLTRNDVEKFRNDIHTKQQDESNNTRIIGLFISLCSDLIPGHGDLSITRDIIFLSKRFISLEHLRVVFSFVEQYIELIQLQPTTEKVEYVLQPDVVNLLVSLNTELQRSHKDLERLDSSRECIRTLLSNNEIDIIRAQMRIQLSGLLSKQLKQFDNILQLSTYDEQYLQFIDWVKRNCKTEKSILKRSVTDNFPALAERISKVSWEDYRHEAWMQVESSKPPSLASSINYNTEDKSSIEKYYSALQELMKTADEKQSFIDYNKHVSECKTTKQLLSKANVIKRFPSLGNILKTTNDYTIFKTICWEYHKLTTN